MRVTRLYFQGFIPAVIERLLEKTLDENNSLLELFWISENLERMVDV
jgi:hypothetical protein